MMRVVLTLTVGVVMTVVGQTLLPCDTVHTMLANETVRIQSENFPDYYSPFMRCIWEITCDPKNMTHLGFSCPEFELEDSPGCAFDRFAIKYKGEPRTLFCGTNSPDSTTTNLGWARVTFSCNGGGQAAKGFQCDITCMNN